MARLSAEQKVTVTARLSSLNTSGLDLPQLAGHTLVTYSGSLTGRDFRIIAQVAPFVLYDMIDKDLLECWTALATLVPLIWQPKIAHLEHHLVCFY